MPLNTMDKDTVKLLNDFCVKNKQDFSDVIGIAEDKLREPADSGGVSFAVSLLEYTALWGEKEAMEKLAGHFSDSGETERAQHYAKAARMRGEHKCLCCGKTIDSSPLETIRAIPASRQFLSDDCAILWAQVYGYCSTECMEKNGLTYPIEFKEWKSCIFGGSDKYSWDMSHSCMPWHFKTMVKYIRLAIIAVAAVLLLIIWGLVALIF